jgi:tRNA(fMet)-specific endonuclease VapC
LNGNAQIGQKVVEVGWANIYLCGASLSELYFGAYNSQRVAENLVKVERLVQVQRLSFTREVMETFGQVKADLKKRGEIIGDFDILIASFALVHGCILVTNNVKHFQRITGLQIENWTQPL